MPIALVQSDPFTVTDGGTAAFTSSPGSLAGLFALISMPSETVVVNGLTDTRGNTWQLARRRTGLAGTVESAELWYARNSSAAPSANTVTCDWSGAASCQVALAEFSGFSTGVAIDTSSDGATDNSASFAHGNITTRTGETLVLQAARVATTHTLSTRGDGFANLSGASRAVNGYLITTSVTIDADLGFAAVEDVVSVLVSFYDGANGVVAQPKPTILRQAVNRAGTY